MSVWHKPSRIWGERISREKKILLDWPTGKSASHCVDWWLMCDGQAQNSSWQAYAIPTQMISGCIKTQTEQAMRYRLVSSTFPVFYFNFCLQVSALSFCPNFSPWWTMMWKYGLNKLPHKLLLVTIFYHNNRKLNYHDYETMNQLVICKGLIHMCYRKK